MAETPTELELTRGALEREISRGIAVDAELARQRRRGDQAEAKRDALNAAIADVRRLCEMTIATSCRAQAIDQATDTLAVLNRALAVPESHEGAPTTDSWLCPRCGSSRWVAASLTGPVEYGGRAIRQCVLCGRYSGDPVDAPQRPEDARTGVSAEGDGS